jgi:hypothetical protein
MCELVKDCLLHLLSPKFKLYKALYRCQNVRDLCKTFRGITRHISPFHLEALIVQTRFGPVFALAALGGGNIKKMARFCRDSRRDAETLLALIGSPLLAMQARGLLYVHPCSMCTFALVGPQLVSKACQYLHSC